MPLLNHTPEKYEAKALAYERRNKPLKAQKNREKALRLRQSHPGFQQGALLQQQGLGFQQGTLLQQGPLLQQGITTTTYQQGGLMGHGGWANWQSTRNPALYEANALKWEQRGNWSKAQKNREKYWRIQNPQYAQYAAPTFYGQNNQFLGYNLPYGAPLQTTNFQTTNYQTSNFQTTNSTNYQAPIVQQVVLPTIVEQTSRAERIVEVQPIIHREIEAPQVRVIEKHLYETVPSAGPSTITNAPIIQETVQTRIMEEVQPVIHREVPAPFVEHVEQHVTEHLVRPTITTKEVMNQQQAFMPAGGVPLQQQQQYY